LDESVRAVPSRARSLSDFQLKGLKPLDKAYKVSDRDGLYAYVSPSGTISLRYDYRIGKRRETLTLGRYDATAPARVPRNLDVLDFGMGLSLAEARLLLTKAKRSLDQGVSPSRAKAEKKAAETDALTFGKWVERYFDFKGDPKSRGEQLADSTLAMRRSTYKRALEKPLGKLMLEEITPNRLATLCDDIKSQRGPAVAVHAREIVLMVFRHAQRKGIEVSNPAERVQASAIARFEPRDRALSPSVDADAKLTHCTEVNVTHLGPLTNPAQLWGCLYVIEGATLGGQIIIKKLSDHLGLTTSSGASFFDGYGPHTGSRWKAFCAAVPADGDDAPGGREAMLSSANLTFDLLGEWLFPGFAGNAGSTGLAGSAAAVASAGSAEFAEAVEVAESRDPLTTPLLSGS
jgi:hypothetical protein